MSWKNKVPHLKAYANRLISSRTILNGNITTFYGPDQDPDVGEIGVYKPPPNWIDPGTPLYDAQVVNLELHIPLIYNGDQIFKINVDVGPPTIAQGPYISAGGPIGFGNYDFTTLTFDSQGGLYLVCEIIGEGAPPPPGSSVSWTAANVGGQTVFTYKTSGSFDPGLSYHSNLSNPFQGEHDRLLQIFNSVKDTIESIRQGRTFINVIDPWQKQPNLSALLPYLDKYFKNIADSTTYEFDPNDTHPYFLYLAPTTTDPFLGTNFLRIYVGCPATVKELVWNPGSDYPDVLKYLNNAKNISQPKLLNCYKGFYNYIIKAFSTNLNLGQHAAYNQKYSPPSSFPTITLIKFEGGGGIVLKDSNSSGISGFDNFNWIPVDNSTYLAGLQTSNNGMITTTNNQLSELQNNEKNRLQSDLQNLVSNKIDAKYVDYSNQISETYLINLIAQTYGFNPSNGKDL